MATAVGIRICAATAALTIAAVARAQYSERPPPPEEPLGPPSLPHAYGPNRLVPNNIVRFEPDSPGIQLLANSGVIPFERYYWGYHYGGWYHGGFARVYSPVCDGPCAIPMPSGPYQLALAKEGGPVVPVPFPVMIQGPSEIRGHYVDRSGTRMAGVLVGIGGTLTAVVMLAASQPHERVCDEFGYCYEHAKPNGALVGGGIGVLLGSIIVGAVMVSQRDEAVITVRPLVPGSAARSMIAVLPVAMRAPQGGSLAIRF
jgi:hypothetical protein